MRRAGGWILGLIAVAAMAGGAWLALGPVLNRETVNVVFLRGNLGRDPSNDAAESGASFALEEAGGRAGRFRIRMVPETELDSPTPTLWIGNSESLYATSSIHLPVLRVSAYQVPLISAGDILLMTGFEGLGGKAVAWAKEAGLKRTALVDDPSSIRSRFVMESFRKEADRIGLEVCAQPDPSLLPPERIEQTLAGNPELVFYAGEEAPYSVTAAFFSALRDRGYTGSLLTVDVDPEVSFLALPSRFPEGTLLMSTISPPSAEFAAKYEPATGRKAGPHAWPGYLAMRAALDVIERAPSSDPGDIHRVVESTPKPSQACSLYVARNGKFEFVKDLK